MSENKIQKYLDPKEMGKEIISAAIEQHKKQQSEKVVKQVQDILERIRTMENTKAKCERNLKLFHAQVRAIEKGEFSISRQDTQVSFNDDDLNRSWEST